MDTFIDPYSMKECNFCQKGKGNRSVKELIPACGHPAPHDFRSRRPWLRKVPTASCGRDAGCVWPPLLRKRGGRWVSFSSVTEKMLSKKPLEKGSSAFSVVFYLFYRLINQESLLSIVRFTIFTAVAEH
jgi:hypothetical protein